MKEEFETFKEDIDSWVKDLNSEINNFKHLPHKVEEHNENIDHNYELLQEMGAEINRLREDISALRIVQLLHLKSDIKQSH